MRKVKFQNDSYYHIYNRGVDKREIFCNEKDYLRFLISIREFNNIDSVESIYRLNQMRRKVETKFLRFEPNRRNLVSIICYCLNPNHFHLLIKQLSENGVQAFMHKLGLGYTNYFNNRYARGGSLFQGTYQAVEVKSSGQLEYVSAYINGNAEIHGIAKAQNYKWCSYPDYLGKRKGTLCNKREIFQYFNNSIGEYKEFVKEIIINSKQIKKEIKEILLEV
ncbi:MAG: transposase [Patescibacteria group bacterium]|nr:transposase [Patescibacteria group bacterium]